MTGKDFIKILLCEYGYDRNIEVKTYYGDYGAPGYEIRAEHENGDVFYSIGCEGLMFTIFEILDYMKQNKVPFKCDWWSVGTKHATDDALREHLVEAWFRNSREHQDWCMKMKPCWEWQQQHRPDCEHCPDNPHDLDFDAIHHKCSLSYFNKCEKIHQWRKDCREYQDRFVEGHGLKKSKNDNSD